MAQMQIEKIPASKLNPAEYNPRRDLQPGDKEFEKLARSIEEFGYVEPIVWNRRTGNIVGGHQRFKVLQSLGITDIDCVVVDLDEVREKMLNVALNKIQGEWDRPKLYKVITEVEREGMEVDVMGLDPKEIQQLYQEVRREMGDYVEDDFDVKAAVDKIETPITRLGDICEIGRHRLMCGDSTSINDVTQLMDGRKARMAFTDPPWNVDYGGAAHPSWKQRSIMNDKMSTEDFYGFLLSAFTAMKGVLELGAIVYCVMSAQEWPNVHAAMTEAGYHWSSTVIWVKDTPVLSRKDYNTQYEPIWYGWLEGAAHLCELLDHKQSDVWQIPRPKKSEEHPTMKPIELVARAINNSSRDGDVILDLFGVSGTTMMAAEQTGRTAFLMELDPKYCDAITLRYGKMNSSYGDIYLIRDGERIPFSQASEM